MKVSETTRSTIAMMRGPVMQKLLEERFRLRVHHETREVPAYLMPVSADGPRLRPTAEGSCNALDPLDLTQSLAIAPGGKPWCAITSPSRQDAKWVWDVKGMTLRLFARLINPGRPVIDRTNLTGAYDIHLEWWNDATSPADNSTASSLFSAIRKEMGLQLQPGRGPVEFLVIDHLERPAQN